MKEIKLLIDDNAEVLVITSCGYLRHNMFNTEVCFNTETIVGKKKSLALDSHRLVYRRRMGDYLLFRT